MHFMRLLRSLRKSCPSLSRALASTSSPRLPSTAARSPLPDVFDYIVRFPSFLSFVCVRVTVL